ncbi:hypothetical protein EYF80_021525 [Liparis tanakae]|uniref:Uncharacterized protein n=1 Tax=Liparis tanakae TaxID=230148 RepID=A0A4Z2HTB4_9TELE|nr:hypothetical protein EYF80_021525 [Liparis tanakae]
MTVTASPWLRPKPGKRWSRSGRPVISAFTITGPRAVDLLREGFSARAGTSHRNYRSSGGLSQVKQCAAHTWDVQITSVSNRVCFGLAVVEDAEWKGQMESEEKERATKRGWRVEISPRLGRLGFVVIGGN